MLRLTQPKNSSTSSGLRMTGSFCGWLGSEMISYHFHGPRRSVTLYNFVQETQSRDSNGDGLRRQVFLFGEIDLISANLLPAQNVGRLGEVASKERDLLQLGNLRVASQTADSHVLDHAFLKRCHGKLLCQGGLCCKQRFHGFAKEGAEEARAIRRRDVVRRTRSTDQL